MTPAPVEAVKNIKNAAGSEKNKVCPYDYLSYMIYVYFFLFSLFVALPGFFPSVINWDESTFILLGQDVLNGHLPFTHYWDIKPPLVSFGYALFIFLFGKSIFAVRFGGMMCTTIAACFTYQTTKHLFDRPAGICAALLMIVSTSSFQATMSEHLCLIPLALILTYLLIKPCSVRNTFIIGVLVGGCVLIRTNLAYVGLGVGAVIFIREWSTGVKHMLCRLLSFFIGGMILPGVILLMYAFNHQWSLLISGLVDVPLAYIAYGEQNVLHKLWAACHVYAKFLFDQNILIGPAILASVYLIYSRCSIFAKKATTIIICLFLLCFYSTIHPEAHRHYFIQFIPFLAMIGGVGLAYGFQFKNKLIHLGLIVLLLFPVNIIWVQYRYLFHHVIYDQQPVQDTGYKIARLLNTYDVSDKYIFLTQYNIVYWLTDAKIPTKYVHPSNLGKERLLKVADGDKASVRQELINILNKRPEFIVTPDWVSFYGLDDNLLLKNEIRHHYTLVKQIDTNFVFQRKRQ